MSSVSLVLTVGALVMASLVFVGGASAAASAGAVAPAVLSLSQQDRHPAATFSAPKADSVSIYFATKPDRATDGSFFSENIAHSAYLTDAEIQAGRWLDPDRLDPGRYFVLLSASPDFSACYLYDQGIYDPACANGYSDVVTLVVAKPQVRYAGQVKVYTDLQRADLTLSAKPLGEKQSYRACYVLKNGKRRCLSGTLDGYSWDSAASDDLSADTRGLPALTTFTWYVGTSPVAVKRVRVDMARERAQVAAEARRESIAPEVVSVSHLRLLSQKRGKSIFWVGPRPGTKLELRLVNGQVYVRYLPVGVEAGSQKRLLTVGTYLVPNAFVKTQASHLPGAVAIPVPGDAVASVQSANPTNAYVAYRGRNYQIEVYSPQARLVRSLVASGRVRPIGD